MYGENHKSTSSSKGKLKTPSSTSFSSIMAIRHKNDDVINKTDLPGESPTKNRKNPWPTDDSGSPSPSWDGDSRATSSSWPEEIEEAATRKVLNLWCAVERTLYKEDEELPLGNIMDECIQWRTQIPHFRVVGTKKRLEILENDSDTGRNDEYKSYSPTDRPIENIATGNNLRQKRSQSAAKHHKQIDEWGKEAIDRILEYVCTELMKEDEVIVDADDNIEVDDVDIGPISKNLDEVLTITPAPTYSGSKNFKSKKIIKSDSRMSSANINKPFQMTERKMNVITSTKSQKNAKKAGYINSTIDVNDLDDSETDESPLQYVRNKPGTVFNEKIVVSPVPYAVTTRESFCTLKTTPIRYAGHLLELSSPQVLNRQLNSASKVGSAHRISPLRIPQRHSAWQTSICPVAWPKNVRLAPIDPSRFPSSKKRSSTVLPSVPQRNRNSLSPIPRPLRIATVTSFASDTAMNEDLLKIHGKQIVTCSMKPNLSKTESNQCCTTNKSIRTHRKIRKSDR